MADQKLAANEEPPRQEQCTRCNQMVTDWIDPDWWRPGRLCIPCIPAAKVEARLAGRNPD